MKCYKHRDRDAIGLCKSCHKGVCPECLVLVGGSVACIDSCQENVATLNYIVEQNKKYRNLDKKLIPFITYGIGIFFLSFGLYTFNKKSSWFTIGFGAILIIISVINTILKNAQAKNPKSQ